MARKDLLPPYLSSQQVWNDMGDAIDAVFALPIDVPKKMIQYLRQTYLISDSLKARIEAPNNDPVLDSSFYLDITELDAESGTLIQNSDFDTWEQEILIKQATMLGFKISDPSLLSQSDYLMITRNIALYWYSKGTPDFIKFLSFCFNTVLTFQNLWSTTGVSWDTYGPFLPEGDPGIGTPVYNGGTWFPTTHINVIYEPIGTDPGITKFIALFNAIANYNLVIHSITLADTATFMSYNGYKYIFNTGTGAWAQQDITGQWLDQLAPTLGNAFTLDSSKLASPPQNYCNIIMMYPLVQIETTLFTVGELNSTFVLDASQLA